MLKCLAIDKRVKKSRPEKKGGGGEVMILGAV